jgi:two-component system, NarL family, nitrate/nitrite response regulator NarL
MIGVVVVAAYPAVRAGLRALIAGEPEIEVLGLQADAGSTPVAPPPAVLLVSVEPEQPHLSERLAAQYPEAAQVLLLDGPEVYAPPEEAGRPWAALRKDAEPAEIIAALRAVSQGLVVLDPAFARLLAPRAAGARAERELEEPLTEREGEVLHLLALGLPNKTIAARLGISEHTAKFHVGSILAKLGAASRTEAVTIAARRGLLVL